jgi:predicted ATPase/DNA-binding XRE family transcriptional regulator
MSGGTLLFGQWLKQRRKSLDITQEDLALQVDCSVSTIEKIESGERRPSRQIAELFADYLRVPNDEREAFLRFARSGSGSPSPLASDAVAPPAPWRAAERQRTNLPVPLTTLVGREEELEAVRSQLLRERVRLVTLTGPPGIGKTRLCIEAAHEVTGEFEDGVYFVPLASVNDPGMVLAALGRALKVKEGYGPSEGLGQSLADRLKEHLGDKRALLVLDNFEHLLPAAPQVADLLAYCPWVKVLVTSREPLRVRGERQIAVPPLDVPDPAQLLSLNLAEPKNQPSALSALAQCPSVALFLERARENNPGFDLTEKSAQAVAAICARLEGVPLAIELVAARSDAASPDMLLEELESKRELRSDRQDVPQRHRTLREATRWSYDLLEEGERRLFARLAVFVGGCTRSAAEAVCNARGDLPLKVGKALSSLAGKSLLTEQRPGEVDEQAGRELRYFIFETIREYALEKLRDSGDEQGTRRLHLEYYLALAVAAQAQLEGPQQAALMTRLEDEHDNLRAALEWALAHHEAALAVQLSGSLVQFWYARGYLSEGRNWLQTALDGTGAWSSPEKAKALVGAASLASRQGDYLEATAQYEQGLEIYRALGDRSGIASALRGLGTVANEQGDYDRADAHYRESLALSRELDDRPALASILNNIGNQALARGKADEAAALYRESLQMAREMGSKQKIATALLNLGRVAMYHHADYEQAVLALTENLALCRDLGSKGGIAASLYQLGRAMLYMGNYARAEALFEESLGLCRQLDEKPGIASTLLGLGLAVLMQGGSMQARLLLVESLALCRDLGLRLGIIECLEGFAGIALAEGMPEEGARLLGSVEAMLEAEGRSLEGLHRPLVERWVEEARARLGELRFATAWEAGHALPPEEAIALAVPGEMAQVT